MSERPTFDSPSVRTMSETRQKKMEETKAPLELLSTQKNGQGAGDYLIDANASASPAMIWPQS